MLDKPDFVGSYDVGEYVYFFFRETAVEFMNCGKTIYSRIARVCKKDIGGKNILHQNWVTYLKARLNCSIPGDFPFFFDEIQDVYKAASGSSSNNEEIFHAVFTTNQNGLKGSAICSFNLKDINNVFDNGKFKEQATSTSMWLPVPTKDVPEPRPGMHTYLFWIMNSTNEVVECIIQKRKEIVKSSKINFTNFCLSIFYIFLSENGKCYIEIRIYEIKFKFDFFTIHIVYSHSF